MTPALRHTVTEHEALVISRRVLRLANGYLRRQRQGLLVTDGRGLMTWGEVRLHIQSALSLKVKR